MLDWILNTSHSCTKKKKKCQPDVAGIDLVYFLSLEHLFGKLLPVFLLFEAIPIIKNKQTHLYQYRGDAC